MRSDRWQMRSGRWRMCWAVGPDGNLRRRSISRGRELDWDRILPGERELAEAGTAGTDPRKKAGQPTLPGDAKEVKHLPEAPTVQNPAGIQRRNQMKKKEERSQPAETVCCTVTDPFIAVIATGAKTFCIFCIKNKRQITLAGFCAASQP